MTTKKKSTLQCIFLPFSVPLLFFLRLRGFEPSSTVVSIIVSWCIILLKMSAKPCEGRKEAFLVITIPILRLLSMNLQQLNV